MSVETTLARHFTYRRVSESEAKASSTKKISPFDYPECGGHPASSSYNWVLTDYLGYHFAKLLRVTDEDMKQKSKS